MSANEIKYLNYWWEPDSIIDPATVTRDYFKVSYDNQGRYIWVERYTASHQLITRDKFIWKDNLILKIEAYDVETNILQKYMVYEYNRRGEPKIKKHYSPDGKLIRREIIE